jgi:NAD(P)-dependent dehydrogenase (short-subunit alcohol dehydrogenase family)
MFVDSLRSRAVLVTGAGGGVGLALAGQLAAAGWTVIVHAGTAEAGDQAVERLVKAGAELTRMLAGPLNKGHGRIVSISSILHRGARLAWTDLTRTKAYSPLAAYGQATLALTMFTRALAKREPSRAGLRNARAPVNDPGIKCQ